MNYQPEVFNAYKAYGLNIQSDLVLPELSADKYAVDSGNGKPDVFIRIGKVDGVPVELRDAYSFILPTREGIYLGWQDIGTFLVRGGREITIDPESGVEERVLRLVALGSVLAMLLHQRGKMMILHASAVGIDGKAVAFVGIKGAGKSTMAAILHKQGHELLADDILAIDMSRPRPVALPGLPHLKLWPDSVSSLGYVPGISSQLHPELEKRGYRVTNGFSETPMPLECIFVLSTGQGPGIAPLRTRAALLELLPHWYGARFGRRLLESLGLSTHFLQCAEVARRVATWRLSRSDRLDEMPVLAQLVEQHLTRELQQVEL